MRGLLLVTLLLGWGLAQTDRRLETSQAVAAVVAAATRDVVLVATSLRSPEVADALRRAAVDRGVRVFILSEARLVAEPAGYLGGLSLLKNVQVRLVRGLPAGLGRAVVDGGVLLEGPLLTDLPSPLEGRPTVASSDPVKTAGAANWFRRAWAGARPYKYAVQTGGGRP